ncbi:YDL129W [Saccharomyces arboricola H-6]|uniref:YDL129W n=1 Tax=Saccharomyces arboricola (strain H-6 / AS 2.3317 / CBS 10644) TaxID=1160507 RepID=J8PQA1_SACAR|nr:YDL129W [Saccharomyces arboricola H-6]
MELRSRRSVEAYLVTPEEPVKNRDEAKMEAKESPAAKEEVDERTSIFSPAYSDIATVESTRKIDDSEYNNFTSHFMPSLKNTRELETTILHLIHRIKEGDEQTLVNEKDLILSVLNRSLASTSHWMLQAQLSELRATSEGRYAVETNLLKKEVEFLKNKAPNTSKTTSSPTKLKLPTEQPLKRKLSLPALAQRPFSSDVGLETQHGTVLPHSWKAKVPKLPLTTPKPTLNVFPQRPSTGTVKREEEDKFDTLKLVENNKPHPRMRRRSDNPATNEYVRVFHLEKKETKSRKK